MRRAQSARVLTWHAACGQGNGWADRTMYGGEEPGSSPPASHLSAPRAYMPPDSSMSEGTYSTQPGAPSVWGTVPSMLLHVEKSKPILWQRRQYLLRWCAVANHYMVPVFVPFQLNY